MPIKKKPTVMFLEWSTKGREFDMQLPIIYFFEKVLKWNIQYKSQFNWPSVTRNVPDMIIMSGVEGAHVGLNWARRIERSKIPLFTQVTEGLFKKKHIGEFVWGHNKTKKIYQNLSMYWSFNSYKMGIKAFPEIKSRIVVSGAVGFDKYKLFKKKNKLTKVIGYAGFDFNSIIANPKNFKYRDRFINYAKNCSSILKNLAISFPEITFLIKPHPGDQGKVPLEVKDLFKLKNIKVDHDISIYDAIRKSDIWLNFNSSTNLDAWIMDKPSITFFTDKKKYSGKFITGSVNENDEQKINYMIREFYKKGSIKRFNKKKFIRDKMIKDYLGYCDGMNHVRFMSFLKPYVEKIENGKATKGIWKLTTKEKLIGVLKHLIYKLSKGKSWIPYFGRYSTFYERFSLDQFYRDKKKAFYEFDIFYKKNYQKIIRVYNNYEKEFKIKKKNYLE
jgi:CDP-glycerol glycerophosphotransferase (TagB/SpsB family)